MSVGYWKGKKLSVEHRKALSEAHKGKPLSEAHKQALSLSLKGKPHRKGWKLSKETREKMFKYRRGRKRPAETIKKISEALLGKAKSLQHRKNIGLAGLGRIPWNKGKLCPEMSGPNHPNWKGGRTVELRGARATYEYRTWRKQVLSRDNNLCQLCGLPGNVADHLKRFAHFPELRFEVTNGRTLCKRCHLETPTYGLRRVEQS